MEGLRAVLFDLDDTLYPEIEFVRSGFHAVAQWAWSTLGVSEETSNQRLMELFNSGVRGKTFNVWLREIGHLGSDEVVSAVAVYRDHVPTISAFPGVPDLLGRLKARYLLGIVTDGHWRTQERKIAALGISGFFAAIVLTDQLGSDCGKPSRRPFLEALQRLEVAAEGACYVGDNVTKDFLGARQVGLKTIWIRKGGGIYGGIEPPSAGHSPDYVIDSIAKLEELLAAM